MRTVFDFCLEELHKMAEELPAKKKNPHVEAAKVIGSGLAGLGAGYAGGAVLAKGLEYLADRGSVAPERLVQKANLARTLIPIVGTAGGIIYPIWQSHQRKVVDDAIESAYNQSPARVPGQ